MTDSPTYTPGQAVYAQTYVNLRSSPGYWGKTAADLIARLKPGTALQVLEGPEEKDNLVWFRVSATSGQDETVSGWVAAATARGRRLIDSASPRPTPRPRPDTSTAPSFRPNQTVRPVASGETAIFVEDPGSGALQPHPHAKLPSAGPFTILDGPRYENDLEWWHVRCPLPDDEVIVGWAPTSTAKGMRVLMPADLPLPSLHKPFTGLFALSQGFAAHPDFYKQFTYDGVPLHGHNGLDFAMPVGNRVLAAAGGEVIKIGEDASGFGLFVLLRHAWGETLYAHLRWVSVQYKQQVEAQEVIGISGNSGASLGPHLHFGMRLLPYQRSDGWGGFCDPAPFLRPGDLISYRGEKWLPSPLGPEDANMPRP